MCDFEYCKKEGNSIVPGRASSPSMPTSNLRAWQSEALGRWEDTAGDRKIMIIYDPRGNHGKTVLAKYCVATHQATYCPMQEAMDFMAFAMAKPDKAYIFDMPRTERQTAQGHVVAIEQIKNGYLYDKRYQFRDMWIDPPRVLVFCNQLPNKNDLTWDRWELYTIRDFRRLGRPRRDGMAQRGGHRMILVLRTGPRRHPIMNRACIALPRNTDARPLETIS